MEWRRLGRFLVVGGSGTALDWGLLALLQPVLPLVPANALAYGAGILNNFWWNRQWTYADMRAQPWQVQLRRFWAVSLIGLALNTALVVALSGPASALLGSGHDSTMPAKLGATLVTVMWNFWANRWWTFSSAQEAL